MNDQATQTRQNSANELNKALDEAFEKLLEPKDSLCCPVCEGDERFCREHGCGSD